MTAWLKTVALAAVLSMVVLPALAQSPDPFRSAPPPAPRPHPTPAPEPTVVIPQPPPPPVGPFDGTWEGTFACPATPSLEAFSVNFTALVKDGQFTVLNQQPPGTPGHWELTGTVSPDAEVTLAGEVISPGGPGKFSRGTTVALRFTGHFSGDQFTATRTNSQRACTMNLTRHH